MYVSNHLVRWQWNLITNQFTGDKDALRLFGFAQSELPNLSLESYLQRVHPDDRAAVNAALARACAAGDQPYVSRHRVLTDSGESLWVSVIASVERDSAGKPVRFSGALADLSELKAAQKRADDLLFRYDQQTRILDITLSSISDFAYVFNREGRFIFVNQALLQLWGLTLENAVGKNFFDLQYPDDLAERLQRQIQTVFSSRQGLIDETQYTSPTGAGGYYEYIFRPVFNRAGDVEFVAGSTRDITDRKRSEEQLRHSQERLRILAETLDAQVRERTLEIELRNHDVSHQADQLRDLSARLMQAQDDERRRIAREMHDSAGQTIAALCMTLSLILRRAGDGDSSLPDLARQALSMARELEAEIRTTSYLLHPPFLDELGLRAALSCYVDGLVSRLGMQVRLNIVECPRLARDVELTIFRVVQESLTNAHRHAASTAAEINLTCDPANIAISVRDFGKGISEQGLFNIRNRITGVGLAGMRERVRPYGGQVTIDSKEGIGTTITVTIPRSSQTDSAADVTDTRSLASSE